MIGGPGFPQFIECSSRIGAGASPYRSGLGPIESGIICLPGREQKLSAFPSVSSFSSPSPGPAFQSRRQAARVDRTPIPRQQRPKKSFWTMAVSEAAREREEGRNVGPDWVDGKGKKPFLDRAAGGSRHPLWTFSIGWAWPSRPDKHSIGTAREPVQEERGYR